MNLTRKDFASLEALRGILALIVVINHARGHGWAGLNWLGGYSYFEGQDLASKVGIVAAYFTQYGHEAVIGFFVLSGLSIAHSLSKKPTYREFLNRRILRLYPPKVGAVVWAVVVFILLRHLYPTIFGPETETWNLSRESDFLDLKNLTLVLLYQPRGHMVAQFWSLPHEMLFYALAPILCAKPGWTFRAGALLFLFRGLAPGQVPSGFLFEFAFHYLFFFALGIELFRYRERILGSHRWRSRTSLSLAIGAGICATVAGKLVHESLGEVAAATVTVLSIQYAVKYPIKTKWLLLLGGQSYSLYLTHFATIILTVCLFHHLTGRPLPEKNPFVWPLGVVTSLCVNLIFYHLFERPSRSLLERSRSNPLRTVHSH